MKYPPATLVRKHLSYNSKTGAVRWKIIIGSRSKKLAGWVDKDGYRIICFLGYEHKLTHLIWVYKTGKWPTRQVDHKNTKKFDNRWRNLRLATNAQNKRNCGRHKDSRSPYKGVCWDKCHQYWVARICLNGKTTWIGAFKTPSAGYRAYKKLARKLFGKFARF